jgi:hypothetical protein
MIKCLEKHNLLIFLKRERIVAKQIFIKHKRWNLGCYSLDDLHASPEMQHQVKGGLLLDVVVGKGTTILELLASKWATPPRGLWFRR